MFRYINARSLLILTTPWLFLQISGATDIAGVKRTQEQLPRLAKRQSLSKQNFENKPLLSAKEAWEDGLPKTISKQLPQRAAELAKVLANKGASLNEIMGLENETTKFLKQQAKSQMEYILGHNLVSNKKYPIQLKDLYFLLAYEYCELAQKEADISKKNQYKSQSDLLNKNASDLGSTLSILLPETLSNSKNDAEKINALENARLRMSYPESNEKVFPLSYCLYGYFLAYNLYQKDSQKDLLDARQILVETLQILQMHTTENQQALTKLGSVSKDNVELIAFDHYLAEWINRCTLLKNAIDQKDAQKHTQAQSTKASDLAKTTKVDANEVAQERMAVPANAVLVSTLEKEKASLDGTKKLERDCLEIDIAFWKWYDAGLHVRNDPIPLELAKVALKHDSTLAENLTAIIRIKSIPNYLIDDDAAIALAKQYQAVYMHFVVQEPMIASAFLKASVMLWNDDLIATLGAHLFRNGLYTQSIHLLNIGVEREDLAAHRPLAEAYRDGKGIEKNPQKAKEILQYAKRIIFEELRNADGESPEFLQKVREQLAPISKRINEDFIEISRFLSPSYKNNLRKSLQAFLEELQSIEAILEYIAEYEPEKLEEMHKKFNPILGAIIEDYVYLSQNYMSNNGFKERLYTLPLDLLKETRTIIKKRLGYVEKYLPGKLRNAHDILNFIHNLLIEVIKAYPEAAYKYMVKTSEGREDLDEALEILESGKFAINELWKYLSEYEPEKLQEAHKHLDPTYSQIMQYIKKVPLT